MSEGGVESLARREVLLLARRGLVFTPSELEVLGPSRGAVEGFLEHLPAGGEAATLARLVRGARPWRRRFASVHETWVEHALNEVPAPLREQARGWLALGIAEEDGRACERGEPEAALRWLQLRCLATFPIGPVHLRGRTGDPLPSAAHVGHLCLLEVEALTELIDRLGLYMLALAVRGSSIRRIAGLQLRLGSEVGERFGEVLEKVMAQSASWRRPLRLQAQASLLRTRREEGDLRETRALLGLDLMAMAVAHRFEYEGRFLAARLPRSQGRMLQQLLPVAAKRGAHAVAEAGLVAVEQMLTSASGGP